MKSVFQKRFNIDGVDFNYHVVKIEPRDGIKNDSDICKVCPSRGTPYCSHRNNVPCGDMFREEGRGLRDFQETHKCLLVKASEDTLTPRYKSVVSEQTEEEKEIIGLLL